MQILDTFKVELVAGDQFNVVISKKIKHHPMIEVALGIDFGRVPINSQFGRILDPTFNVDVFIEGHRVVVRFISSGFGMTV